VTSSSKPGLLRRFGDIDPVSLLISGLSLLVVLVVRRWPPVVPGSQIVVLLAIAANAALQLDHHAVGHRGPVESGLPAT